MPELSALLSTVIDLRSQVAQLQAQEAEVLAAAGAIAETESQQLPQNVGADSSMPFRSLAAEFGAGMRISDRTAQVEINDAMTLVDEYPATLLSWRHGKISRTHVHAILKAGGDVSEPEARAQFDRDIAPLAESQTPGHLRKTAVALAEKAQPRTLKERHTNAREARCVWVTNLADGMAQIDAVVPAIIAHGMLDRLTRQARALKDVSTASGAIENRSMDQVRADLLADVVLTSAPSADELAGLTGDAPGGLGAIRAIVQVTVPATTLAGTNEIPGDLAGLTLVDPESARRLAGNAPGWDRVFTHPLTGGVLAVDRYRPSDHLKRYLRARDQHCRFPGCRMPVTLCDIDHTIDAALNGPTTASNLAHLCRRHHSMKHATAWTLTQTSEGTLRWASPTGRVYIDQPPGVAFEPDPDPGPGREPEPDPAPAPAPGPHSEPDQGPGQDPDQDPGQEEVDPRDSADGIGAAAPDEPLAPWFTASTLPAHHTS